MNAGLAFTVFWTLWIAAFLVIEIVALRRKAPGDTLSEKVWAILRFKPAWFVGAGFLTWLVIHFLGFGVV